jgi:hypothetical protein
VVPFALHTAGPQGVGERVRYLSHQWEEQLWSLLPAVGLSLMRCLHCIAARPRWIALLAAQDEMILGNRSIVSAPVPSYCPPFHDLLRVTTLLFMASNGWMYQLGGHFDGVSACLLSPFLMEGWHACPLPACHHRPRFKSNLTDYY